MKLWHSHRSEDLQPAESRRGESSPPCSAPMMQRCDPPQTGRAPPPEPEPWKQASPQPGRRRREITDYYRDTFIQPFDKCLTNKSHFSLKAVTYIKQNKTLSLFLVDKICWWLTGALDACVYRSLGKVTSASSVVLVELLACITHTHTHYVVKCREDNRDQ